MTQLFLLKIFLLLILMIAPVPLLAVETIEIVVEDKASPWSMDDGTGFANDVIVAAFAAVNVKAILLTMPYSRCKKEVLRGNVAACLSMSWNDSFEGLIQFSEKPLFSCNSDYYYNVRKPIAATREMRRFEKVTKTAPNTKTPILALTAYTTKNDLELALAAGCDGYITKPFSKTKLLEAMQPFL